MRARMSGWQVLCAALVSVAATFLIGEPAKAAKCRLLVIADLPVTMQGDRPSVPAKVNGQDTRFWLDSGAFFSIMPQAKAAELALRPGPIPGGMQIIGIGGSATVQLATIKSFGIVGQELKNVQFLVGGSDFGNGLIGRNILTQGDTEFDLADGSVKLMDPRDCEHASMTYWAPDKPNFVVPLMSDLGKPDRDFKLPVLINGQKILAALDTGAETSVLKRSAAIRAGIDLTGPEVVPSVGGGFGRRFVKSWIVPVARIEVGDEQILNTHIVVLDDGLVGDSYLPDMLLGEDYIMAHHIYVAWRQHLIFFTYTGGRPFRTQEAEPGGSGSAAADRAALNAALPPGTHLVEAVANNAGDPKTAEAFARRGAARLSSHDLAGALADLSEAIRQSPDTADYYADRATAYSVSGNAAAARSDLDRALTLNPRNGHLLGVRASLRLASKDRAGALADAEAATRVIPAPSLDNIHLASLFVRLGQPARAVPMLDAVIAAHPEDSEFDAILNERCWARALANIALDRALADCNRAIRDSGAQPDLLDSRGLVYFRQGKYPLAISDYNAGLKVEPKMAWSLFMRGQADIALGQTAAGKADQAAAQAIQPDIADEVARYGIGVKGS